MVQRFVPVAIIIGYEILHIHGALPVHILVHLFRLMVVNPTVHTTHIQTDGVAEQVLGMSRHTHDGQVVIVCCFDKRTCRNRTGQIAFLREHEAVDGGLIDRETSVGRHRTIAWNGCSSTYFVIERSP